MVEVIFWCVTASLVHTYALYPAVLVAWEGARQAHGTLRRFSSGRERRAITQANDLPSVSLVVAAYNEESCIHRKISGTLQLEYPRYKLELLIGSDGSTDSTDALVKAEKSERVRLSSAPRGGKSSVLNRCLPMARGEIVVLSDANTDIEADAIARLVRHFEDPKVGAVCGALRLFNPSKQDYEESAYWKYESLLKFLEGKHGAVVGANGGIYAIRRNLFEPLDSATIVDDFVIPMRILARGYRVVYEPEAIAYEETTEDYSKEFGRRARISAGNFQSLRWLYPLLSPSQGFAAFAFWSHKVLRWAAPAMMAAALVSNLLLVDRPFYQATLFLQLAFYGLAALGAMRVGWVKGISTLRKASSVAYYFVSMNMALAVGFWRFLARSQRAAWERTARAG